MDAKTNFKLIIIQTELERFKFLVRSFLRARIKKVYAHSATCTMGTLMLTTDRPAPSTHPGAPYSFLRHARAASFAFRTPVSYIAPVATLGALLLLVS
jgi:hypothetical protein